MLIRIVLILLIFVSCTPQKRLERLLKKHPNLIKDSVITRIDTIIKEGTRFDTIYVSKPIDSLIIDTNGINVKVYRIYDTLRVRLQTRADTMYVKNKEVVRYINKGKENNFMLYILIGAVLTLFLIIIFKK